MQPLPKLHFYSAVFSAENGSTPSPLLYEAAQGPNFTRGLDSLGNIKNTRGNSIHGGLPSFTGKTEIYATSLDLFRSYITSFSHRKEHPEENNDSHQGCDQSHLSAPSPYNYSVHFLRFKRLAASGSRHKTAAERKCYSL